MNVSQAESLDRKRRVRVGRLVAVLVVAGGGIVWFVFFGGPGATVTFGPGDLNLLLITLDTTRADAIGCYGQAAARTPNLDRLASQGAMFPRCSTCTSLTLPSHCSIMTGLYPFVHGVRRNGTQRLADCTVTLAELLGEAGLRTQAVVASFVLDRRFGLGQGFEEFSDVPAGDAPIAVHAERYGDDIGDDAIERLRTLAPGRFFLWVHFYDPHYPYRTTDPAKVESFAAYADEVTFMDWHVGRLLRELRDLEIERKTLVVVVGDHGEAMAEHDEYQHGYFTYETTLHVPLLFSCPGVIPGGRRINGRVRTIDVAPTVLDLLGLPAPSVVQGQSLAPLLRDEAGGAAQPAYSESLEAHCQFGLSPLRCIVADRWKYILAPSPELYDLEADPGEEHNLIAEQPEIATGLREQLRSLIADAPSAPSAVDTVAELGVEEMLRLESLGYVGGGSVSDGQTSDELDRFEPAGADPKNYTETFRLYSQSHWALTTGQFALAERYLRQLVAAVPDAGRVRGDLAYVLQQQGEFTEAARMYERAVLLAPQDGYIRRMYGGLLIRTQQWAEAVGQLTIAVATRPDDLEVHYNLGIACGFLDRYAEAADHLGRVLELDPRHVSSLHAMGVLLVKQNKPAEAAEWFRKALEVDPSHHGAQRDLRAVEAMDDEH